jgi:tartrate dehydrogenase/decarboxylase/D-malate dehydrogenase
MAYKIALIPGDGIGKEVVPEGVRTMRVLAKKFGFEASFAEFPYSCQYYIDNGVMMPPDALETLKSFDTILLGAVGAPVSPTTFPCGGFCCRSAEPSTSM